MGTGAILLVGLAISVGIALLASTVVDHDEQRLLTVQAGQIATVLQAAIPSTQTSLEVAASVAHSTDGARDKFAHTMGGLVGTGPMDFTTAMLWRYTPVGPQLVARLGAPPSVGARELRTFVATASTRPTFVVREATRDGRTYLCYALASRGGSPSFAVYTERPLPANRHATVASNAAFSEVNYAFYFGRGQATSKLLTTDFATLPVHDTHSVVTVPFGNTVLTIVVAARTPLVGTLPTLLPWIILGLGIVLSALAAVAARRLLRERRLAELAEGDLHARSARLAALYTQQREISTTLQTALLPRALPMIPGIESAARYLAASTGADIGGDWYTLVALDDGSFGFVIGDVSGRGLAAASTMAAMRFTGRAYALEGDTPTEILAKCARQFDIDEGGHMATVLVGTGRAATREVTLANAGHLDPLLVDAFGARFVPTRVGRPLGVRGGAYESVTITMPPHSTLIGFTDGLVERRSEPVDVGMERLRQVAIEHHDEPLERMLQAILTELDTSSSEDDIAILALRLRG